MPISGLPPATVSAIGSTSALYDSCSVIKELIDNALDAGATSVSVEISPNALDILQVKDNGSGIGLDDRELMCKPSHTSKIRSLDDLRNVSHRSLGFRGLALASIVEMSGSMIITTRAGGEALGSSLQYDRTGQIVRREKIAHPVGTTLRVSDFLKHVPVRRKSSLKRSTRILSDIKKLQQAYAMARPTIRFSLKVLGGKGDIDWVYPGKVESSVMDAVLKVAGADIASQCAIKTTEVRDSGDKDTSPEFVDSGCDADPGRIHVVAVALKEDGDFSKASSCRQYVSVDGRPLSTDKGIAKTFVKLYKSYINSVNRVVDKPIVVSPFLCLNVSLSPGSYDANVEPSKDDVLLDHDSSVLSVVENLLKEVYGHKSANYTDVPVSRPGTSGTTTTSYSGELKSIHDEPSSLTTAHGESLDSRNGHVTSGISQAVLSFRPCRKRLSEKRSGVVNPPQGQRSNPHSERISKPRRTWIWPDKPTTSNDNLVPRDSSSQLLTPRREGNESPGRPAHVEHRGIAQSPVQHSNGSPLKAAWSTCEDLTRGSKSTSTQMSHGVREVNTNGTLDSWIGRLTPLPTPSRNQDRTIPVAEADEGGPIAENDLDSRFGRSRGLDVDVLESQSSSPSHRQQLVFPSQSTEIGLGGDSQVLRPSPNANPNTNYSSQEMSSLPPLEEALDFERRKKQAVQYKRWETHSRTGTDALGNQTCGTTGRPRASTGHTLADSGTQNHATGVSISRDASIATSGPSATRTEASTRPKLPDNDPRSYYMRHSDFLRTDATRMAKTPLRRIPTDRLPLESVSEKAAIHHLSITVASNNCARLPSLVEALSVSDTYARSGCTSYDILRPLPSEVIQDWRKKLMGAAQQRLSQHTSDFVSTFSVDLHSSLKRHRDLHGNECDESMKL